MLFRIKDDITSAAPLTSSHMKHKNRAVTYSFTEHVSIRILHYYIIPLYLTPTQSVFLHFSHIFPFSFTFYIYISFTFAISLFPSYSSSITPLLHFALHFTVHLTYWYIIPLFKYILHHCIIAYGELNLRIAWWSCLYRLSETLSLLTHPAAPCCTSSAYK